MREEAEEKLQEYMQSSPAPMADAGTFSQDIRVKEIQIRNLQRRMDCFEGKATLINSMSKAELRNLKDDLGKAQLRVDVALTKNAE